ncbi:MAG: FAD-binding protein [Actinomycetota bacterium]
MPTLETTDPVLHEFAELVGDTDPIAVQGGGTRWHLGGVLHERARVVEAPAGIVDYQPSEMIAVVRAGTTVADLQAALAAAGQTSALPDRGGTVGGAVVVGENRLDRLGRGSVRDAVLQVRYVAADGQLVTGGGPVVKNVSGFNLPKLMVGSLGTLGLIAEVVIRTNPLPPLQRWIRAERVDPRDLRDSLLRPGAVLWDGTSSWALVEGHAVDVDAELDRLRQLSSIVEVDTPPELPPYRWSLSPTDAAHVDREIDGSFIASIGVGTVWTDRAQPPRELDPVTAQIAQRAKMLFDPTGRFNPGREPGG